MIDKEGNDKTIIETEEKTMENSDMKKTMIFRQQDGPMNKTIIEKEYNDG